MKVSKISGFATSFRFCFAGTIKARIEKKNEFSVKARTRAFQTVVKSCMGDNSTCPGGADVPMNCWDTSGITDMQGAFFGSHFYGDFNEPLECWDTSNVSDMSYMFYFADKFNQDINRWDTSQVTRMRSMFYETESLDQNFEDWDVGKVTHMGWMFDLTKEGAECPSWAANVGGTLSEGKVVTTGVTAEDDSYVRGNCEHPPESAAATRTNAAAVTFVASVVMGTVLYSF